MYYTDRQMAIMEFLQRYRRLRGVSPTLEEIAESFGVSKVTVYDHVRQLEKKGALRKERHKARALEILDPNFLEVAPAPGAEEGILPITVLGSIAAGQPIDALENPEVLDLADLVPMGREHYALRVQGNSMIEDGIHDGDLVIVERRNVADDGETVVAIVGDNEATLKRFYREPGKGKMQYRLQPANSNMNPIYVDRLEIRGVAVGVLRGL